MITGWLGIVLSFYHTETHSWFFNFHDNCPNTFPIWFYYWWTWFGCSTTILQTEAKEGWDFREKNISSLEPYTKEVQFFWTFNIAWIFSWEYRLQDHLLNSFPLSMVWIYKIKWWNEYKTKLCGKENVQYFWKTETKKFTLHNLHTFEKKKEIATEPFALAKRESPPTSTKARVKGLSLSLIHIWRCRRRG